MIEILGQSYAFDDPLVLMALGGAALVLLLFVLLIVTMRAAARTARLAEPVLRNLDALGGRVQAVSDGQHQLAGGLRHVSEAQAASQTKMLALMEQRLAEVSRGMTESLHGSSTRTARSLGELQGRLATIDKAQANTRKAFGRCAQPAGYPVEQADPRGFRRDPVDRYRPQGAAARCLHAAGDAVERQARRLPDPLGRTRPAPSSSTPSSRWRPMRLCAGPRTRCRRSRRSG